MGDWLPELEDSAASGVTSVNFSAADNGQLRLLEEKRIELERELQSERSVREQEVAEFAVKSAELTRANEELQKTLEAKKSELANALEVMESLRFDTESHRREVEDHKRIVHQAENAAVEQQSAITSLESRFKKVEVKLQEVTAEKLALQSELHEAHSSRRSLDDDLTDLESKYDRLEERKRELLEALGERERTLRDHRSEAELDHATLEKEITEVKERSAAQINDVERKVRAAVTEINKLKTAASVKENEISELQVMCNERGKAIEDTQIQSQNYASQVRVLLNHIKLFYDPLAAFLITFIDERIPLAPTTLSPAKEGTLSEPSDYHSPSFNVVSIEAAIASLGRMDSTLIELAKEKIKLCATQTKKWQKECKRYRDRAEKAITSAKEKIAFRRSAILLICICVRFKLKPISP